MYTLILTANGLHTNPGITLIKKALKNTDLSDKKIFLLSPSHYKITEHLISACKRLGFKEKNVFLSSDYKEKASIPSVSYVYITEGNAFEILAYIKRYHFDQYISEVILNGGTFIGSSAGAMIAGNDIFLAQDFDKNTVGLKEYDALKLFSGTVIPHYTYKQLQNYISASDKQVIQKYEQIYNIADNELLLLHITDTPSGKIINKKKRIRLEETNGNFIYK